jgi:hypothetical protein
MLQAAIALYQHVPLEEEPMTFQVVLEGTDGLIVGSDKRVGVRSSDARTGGIQFMRGTKFKKTKDESMICFIAGGPQALQVATAIIAKANANHLGEPRDAEWPGFLEEAANTVTSNSVGDEVIVIRKAIPDAYLVTRSGRDVGCAQITQRLCTGVNVTARFLTQHFWQALPVERLKPLALLALDFAAQESPSLVGFGFDVLTIRNGGTTWEEYSEDDKRIREVRDGFKTSVLSSVFPTAP